MDARELLLKDALNEAIKSNRRCRFYIRTTFAFAVIDLVLAFVILLEVI